MKKLIGLLAVAVALGGCTSEAQRAATYCENMGLSAEDPAYWACIQNAEIMNEYDRQVWLGVAQTGFQMMQTGY